jgi:SAM-dependent methyltransferase
MDLLRTRSLDHELLDAERLDPGELALNLREMALLNRLPGGIGDSLRAVERLIGDQADASVLDVGAGSGDFVRALQRRRQVMAIASDLRPEVLQVAARNLAHTSSVRLLQADVRALPLQSGAVDVAHASLLLHHLDPHDAVVALREMRRVARLGVVINDLRRGVLAFAATSLAVLSLCRGAWTRHDGIVSARRAYTLHELDELAGEAGLSLAWRTGRLWPRVTSVYR